MRYLTEQMKKVPVNGKYDVFVAGGGIAGISAALAAARKGAKVILTEKQCVLGGLATAGLVTIYLPLCDGEGRQVTYGIAEELLKLSMLHGYDGKYPKPWVEGGTKEEKAKTRYEVQFNPALFALEAERILVEAGVKILYNTAICSVQMKDKKITAVICENKTGRIAYEVKSVIDATGDADICKFAGTKTEEYKRGNILAAWNYVLKDGKVNLKMMGFAEKPDNEKTVEDVKPLSDRRFSGLDGEEISEMLIMAHSSVLNAFNQSEKTDNPEVPVILPTMPQLRMTRRICGEYTLSDEEMHKSFIDSIGLISDWRKSGPVYEVPFRTLYTNAVQNLICAGRCISVTEKMWDISRVIPPCAVTGQAAGTAAAMTDNFADLDISLLQKELASDGVVLHENDIAE